MLNNFLFTLGGSNLRVLDFSCIYGVLIGWRKINVVVVVLFNFVKYFEFINLFLCFIPNTILFFLLINLSENNFSLKNTVNSYVIYYINIQNIDNPVPTKHKRE